MHNLFNFWFEQNKTPDEITEKERNKGVLVTFLVFVIFFGVFIYVEKAFDQIDQRRLSEGVNSLQNSLAKDASNPFPDYVKTK